MSDESTIEPGIEPGTEPANRFRHLPAPVRREDLRTSQDVVDHPEPMGEEDRERSWLLRTAGAL